MQIWQESVWQRGAWHEFWTNFAEEDITQNCPVIKVYIFLPAKLAQINTYIRRYLNVGKIKINREKIGPFNFWRFQDPFSRTLTQNLPIVKSSNFTSILALFHFK